MNAAAPIRFLGAAAWPLTIWPSLSRLQDHGGDDYVERTFPIIATAIGFWLCAGVLAVVAYSAGGFNVLSGEDDAGIVSMSLRSGNVISGVLWFFLPVIYIIGLWLYTAREEAFPR